MQKNLIQKVIVGCIIVLFLGASFVSSLRGTNDTTLYRQMDIDSTPSKVTFFTGGGDSRSGSSNWFTDRRLTDNGSRSDSPVIAIDSSQNLHIVWEDDRDGNWEIYYKKINNNGDELVADTRLTSDTQNSRFPTSGIDSTDNVHVFWQDNRPGNWEIYYTKLDTIGNTLIDDTRITNAAYKSQNPVVQISQADILHLAWQDSRTGDFEIYYKKLDSTGGSLTEDSRLTFEGVGSEEPSLALVSEYLAKVAWQDYRDGDWEIYYEDATLDVTTVSLTYESSDPDPNKHYLAVVGTSITVQARIANTGDIAVSNVDVEFRVDDTLIGSGQVSINASASQLISCNWTPDQPGVLTLNVSVDPTHALAEVDRVDNNKTREILVVDPSNVHDTLTISGSEMYDNTILACNNLNVEPSGELNIMNSRLILFGSNSEVTIDGMAQVINSHISSSHDAEYIAQFTVNPSSPLFLLADCTVRNLGGAGLLLSSPNVSVSANQFENSQGSAITCMNLPTFVNLSDNTILDSGLYDFDLINAHVNVINTLFDLDNTNLDGTSELHCLKDVQVTVWNETNHREEGAFVRINDTFNTTVYEGYTDTSGETSTVRLTVSEQTPGSVSLYAPFAVTTMNLSTGSTGTIPLFTDAMLFPGSHGVQSYGKQYTVTKYALIVAGLDSTSQGNDRYRFWNDAEFVYHCLKLRGWKDSNIYFLFMDGLNNKKQVDARIDFRANTSNVNKSLRLIGENIRYDGDHRDMLLIYMGDHGSGDGKGYSQLCMYDGGQVTDNQFAYWLNKYIGKNATKTIIVMDQCYDGGFIDNLHGYDRIVYSATPKHLYSWGYFEGQEDPDNDSYIYDGHCYFPVEFFSAFHHQSGGVGYYPDGHLNAYTANNPTDFHQKYPASNPYHGTTTKSDLDDDSDGIITYHEAFDYALDHDLWGPVDGREQARLYNLWGGKREYPVEVDEDIVVLSGRSGDVGIMWSDGDGTYSGHTVPYGGNPEKILATTCDGNIFHDILVLDPTANQVGILFNNRYGVYETLNVSVYSSAVDFCAAKLNSSWTYKDIIALGAYSIVSVLINNLDRTFTRTDYAMSDSWSAPVALIAADLDGNHRSFNDFAVLSKNGWVAARWNDGSGGFATKSNLFQIPSGTPSGMTVGDLDWDDDYDLIITAIDPDRIYVYANNGTGVFSLAQTISTDNDPAFPTLVDVTLEYYPWTSHMLVVANMSSSRYGYQVYTTFLSTSFTYRFGSDLLIQGSRGKPFGIFLTDIDGDEDYDIVIPVICTGTYDLIVARNNDYNNEGKWTFANKREMDINRKNLLNALKPNAVHGTNFNLGYNT